MNFDQQFSQIASLLGDRARSLMLWYLLDGRAYTATELAICADVSPQSASNHLKKLVDADILKVEKQGRHRYYRFASPDAAYAIESLANLLPSEKESLKKEIPDPIGAAYARTCYDHLAGRLGVRITDALLDKGFIKTAGEKYDITEDGIDWFESLDIDITILKSKRRSFAHPCLDWTERRHHLAGALGAALLDKMISKGWIRKQRNSREVDITYVGQKMLSGLLKEKTNK
jgi:DNA-binding transcriptional ArsR family regulator